MTIDVKDAGGVTRTLQVPNTNGRASAANSRPVVLSNEDKALLPAALGSLGGLKVESLASDYETVAASATAQVLGATGAAGDLIQGILVIPATSIPGQILLLDNATSITIFVGGASSIVDLKPFFVPLGLKSVSGAWKLTTGANVSAIGIGKFT